MSINSSFSGFNPIFMKKIGWKFYNSYVHVYLLVAIVISGFLKTYI